MNTLEEKVGVFYTLLTNAYRDEEQRAEVPKLTLNLTGVGDFTEDFTAMLLAMELIYEAVCPQTAKDMDLIGFTHALNRLAIQFCFGDQIEAAAEEE